MVNITHKSNSLRKAIASAELLVSDEATILAIREGKVPKGDVFSFARVAALFAVKKTSDIIPDCHPLPVEFTEVNFEIKGMSVLITVEVHTIYKTGVEVEAMHGASVAALTLYDMLKPIDQKIEIRQIRLLHKEGGKSDKAKTMGQNLTAAVIVCSDTVSQKKGTDKSGLVIIEALKKTGVSINKYMIIPDDASAIREQAEQSANEGVDLLLFIGGTGASPRDVTPDVIRPLLTRELPGVMEQARNYGQQRTPYAMLSRGVAGFIDNTFVITLPGSAKGAKETFEAIFPFILHLFPVMEGKRHDD